LQKYINFVPFFLASLTACLNQVVKIFGIIEVYKSQGVIITISELIIAFLAFGLSGTFGCK
jgi:ABC-type glycerol-3-phosphate transport system permease component